MPPIPSVGLPGAALCMRPIDPRQLVLTKIRCRFGSNATPPQFPPPIVEGKTLEPPARKGVYGPLFGYLFSRSAQNFLLSGESSASSDSDMLLRASGGGFNGNGCVGQLFSPGTSLAGTGLSSAPKIGMPVILFKIKRSPILVVSATAGMVWPFRIRVSNVGGAATS